MNRSKLVKGFLVVFLLFALGGAVVLVQRQQELRRQAATGVLTPPLTPPEALCSRKSAGDADCNDRIDLMDFLMWFSVYRRNLNSQPVTQEEIDEVDFNGNSGADLNDFMVWLTSYRIELGNY